VAWALGTSTIIATAFLSTEVIELLAELFERFG
jgi:hypothetical protein